MSSYTNTFFKPYNVMFIVYSCCNIACTQMIYSQATVLCYYYDACFWISIIPKIWVLNIIFNCCVALNFETVCNMSFLSYL